MAKGIVKWFNPSKGFGFIVPDEGGSDVFVHQSALDKAGFHGLNDGVAIEYDLITDQKNGKMKAENLKLA